MRPLSPSKFTSGLRLVDKLGSKHNADCKALICALAIDEVLHAYPHLSWAHIHFRNWNYFHAYALGNPKFAYGLRFLLRERAQYTFLGFETDAAALRNAELDMELVVAIEAMEEAA